MSYQLAQKAMGQLGGPWGWFSIWLDSPAFNGQPAMLLFDGWMWTDRGTAQFIARRATGAIRPSGARQYDYWVDERGQRNERVDTNYRWREMTAGMPATFSWSPRPPHTSWVYTNSLVAGQINKSAMDEVSGEVCVKDRFCLRVKDVAGNIVS